MQALNLSDIIAAVSGPAGALAVLVIIWWLQVTGRVIPGGLHKQITADKDQQIAQWKAAYDAERQAHDLERARSDAALLAAQTTNTVLQALHREAVRQ